MFIYLICLVDIILKLRIIKIFIKLKVLVNDYCILFKYWILICMKYLKYSYIFFFNIVVFIGYYYEKGFS